MPPLPCPFCGSKAMQLRTSGRRLLDEVTCPDNNGCPGGGRWNTVAEWNRRENSLGGEEASLLTGDRERLLKLVRPFVAIHIDDEPCHFDHHGNCQAHGWAKDEACVAVAAKRVLEAIDRSRSSSPTHTCREVPGPCAGCENEAESSADFGASPVPEKDNNG